MMSVIFLAMVFMITLVFGGTIVLFTEPITCAPWVFLLFIEGALFMRATDSLSKETHIRIRVVNGAYHILINRKGKRAKAIVADHHDKFHLISIEGVGNSEMYMSIIDLYEIAKILINFIERKQK